MDTHGWKEDERKSIKSKGKSRLTGAGAQAYTFTRVKAYRVDEASRDEGRRSGVTDSRSIEGLPAQDIPKNAYPCGAATCG
jgi:hypothetical protein